LPRASLRITGSTGVVRIEPAEPFRSRQYNALVLVSRPESSALAEGERTRAELAEMGLTNQYLFLNAVFVASDATDSAALALQHRGREAMKNMPEQLASLPRLEIPLLPFAPMGVSNLGRVFESDSPLTAHIDPVQVGSTTLPGPLVSLIDEIEKMGRGVVMTMGKGGVGKTTIAAAVAVELAHRGHKVRLSTTDPAAHIAATVDAGVPNLQVSRIDPALETRRYTQEIMAKSAPQLDQQGQALLEEDLRSPCTEEIAVFRAFAETVAGGKQGFVVLDTAPTGHTLLLLDAAEAYHRDVLRSMSDMPDSVRNLLPRLRDSEFTKVLLVTLPEATPVHEAGKLQDDLRRAGITPFAWVINQSFATNGFRDPVLVERGLRELPYIEEVRDRFASRLALVPWKAEAPVGPVLLRELVQTEVACGR
jgi:arsenite-transporting ATPase